MDPTIKLNDLLYLNSEYKLPISKTLKQLINEGAVLNKTHFSGDYIPLYTVIRDGYDIELVKILKDAWWDYRYYYENTDDLPCCATGDVYIIKYTINILLNFLYGYSLKRDDVDKVKFLKKCAFLFDIKLLEDDTRRHKLIYSKARKYNDRKDKELNEYSCV